MQTFIYVLHFLVCFVLIGVVLLQRGKGQDLGASLGGGSANTIFGSRGAGNFLTRITTASAIIFMGTSLTLSYLGYKSSDVRLFDESEPFVPETGALPQPESSGLEEVPSAAAAAGDSTEGGLVEVPSASGDAPPAGDAAAPSSDEAVPAP
ncbi:MAG: preprotein translocase subunit SecG [Myxococcota bacterium]